MTKLTRQSLQSLRRSLTSEVMMIHAPVLASWMETLDMAIADSIHSAHTLREMLGVRAAADRMRITQAGVAIIPVTGMIRHKNDIYVRFGLGTSNLQVAADVREAVANPKVRAVVLDVDSPGGMAMGNEEAALQIYNARGTKPIAASINGYGASAAYYLASAVDPGRVYASASSIVPSVGTLLMHADVSEAWSKFGVKWTSIHHGKDKGTGSSVVPLSDRGKQLLQEFVDGHGEQFVAAVARNRGISVADVNARFKQGWVFATADQAKEAGAIDQVGNLEDVLASVVESSHEQEASESHSAAATAVDTILANALPTGMLDSQMSGWSVQLPHNEHTATVPSQESSLPAADAANTTRKETPTVNKRIKAALYALGMVDAQDAGDDVCNAALNAFYLASHKSRPEDDEQICKDLGRALAGSDDTASSSASTATATTQEATEQPKEIEERIITRNKTIRAQAKLMGASQEMVDHVLDKGLNTDQALEYFRAELAKQEQSVDTSDQITTGDAAHQKLTTMAEAVVLDRAGMLPADQRPEGFAQHRNASVMEFVEADLKARGIRTSGMGRETMALNFLQRGGNQVEVLDSSGGSYRRPGDYPNLLSNLMGKIIDQAIEIAAPTYPRWTARLPDSPDFKPKTIIGMGGFEELSMVEDGDLAEQVNDSEEVVGWIKNDRYNGKVGLTPVMLANDDTDAFVTGLMKLAEAHEMTLNRLCVELMADNPTLLDGTALFHADHNNLVDSGGAPSETEAGKMWQQWFQMTDIGTTRTIRTPPEIILYPAILDYKVQQNFAPFAGMAESKQAATDGNLNIFRGQFQLVREPELDAFSSVIWYWLANPRRRRVIVHMFMQGYGPGGRRTTWFDPDSETRWHKLEGRFGAANAGHRGALRNDGQ